MQQITPEQMQQIEGGDWLDFVKGAACGGAIVAGVYFTGPVGAVWAVRSGAAATCVALFFA